MLIVPQINGNVHSWVSIEAAIVGGLGPGIFSSSLVGAVKSLDYNDTMDPQKIRGFSIQPIGRTAGIYDATGSIELYMQEADRFFQAIGGTIKANGFGLQSFDLQIRYREAGALRSDLLKACRVKKVSHSGSEGADAATIKCDLDIMMISWNGQTLDYQPMLISPTSGF